MAFHTKPSTAEDIKEPALMDRIATHSAEQIIRTFPLLGRFPDLPRRLSRYKRDLIYSSEVSETMEEANFCIALALMLNFGLQIKPDIVGAVTVLNANLRQRVDDLVRCCDDSVLNLHPGLSSYLISKG